MLAVCVGDLCRWNGTAFTWEADPKHVPMILQELNLLEAKGKTIPGAKDTGSNMSEADDELETDEAQLFQRVCGRLIYYSLDRIEIPFSVKEAANGIYCLLFIIIQGYCPHYIHYIE